MLKFNDYPNCEKVFSFFSEFSNIPRGSGNTAQIAEYLTSFAKERGLEYIRDEFDNVIIKKDATAGYEDRPTVILQGHTDMVAEKDANCDIDMNKEGLRLYRDGDFLRAEGTTLGGDDGVAMAYALAILDSKEIRHPAIEALFTSDEEVGLTGATGLDASPLSGRLLINIDSDEEGVFTVGCAGGLRSDVTLPITRESSEGDCYKLTVSGLLGGHSGIMIGKNRENAIKLLCRVLSSLPDIRIVDIFGGNADNAIPRDAVAIFKTSADPTAAFNAVKTDILGEIGQKEPDASLTLTAEESNDTPISADSTKALISLVSEEPTGVIAMSADIEGLVETSLNLGIIRCGESKANVSFSIRSSKDAEKKRVKSKVRAIAEDHGAAVDEHGEYPAWEYRKDSHLRDVMCDIYEKMYSKKPSVIAIHAGLECGIFAGKMPGLDCVSIGPDNLDIHTPCERLSISSTARVYDFILEVLKNI